MDEALNQIAQTAYERLAALRDQEADLKARLANIQKEKPQAEAAIDRVELLRSGGIKLPQFACVNCYVVHDRKTEMRPIASDSDVDLMRCRECGHEIEIHS
jgi:hypothetical protein